MNTGIFERLGIDSGIIIIICIALILLLSIMIIMLLLRTGKINKKVDRFMRGKDGESLESTIVQIIREIEDLHEANEIFKKKINNNTKYITSAFRKMGLLKYDSTSNMGGKTSFVLVMLDQENNGFLLNVMHSRDGAYPFIKKIEKGLCNVTLGEEEELALEDALK